MSERNIMSDKVRVPFGDNASDTATLLLAAAEESDQDVSVVQVSSLGGFLVPEEIAKKAGLDYEDPDIADGSKYSEEQIEEAKGTPLETPGDPVEEEAPKPVKKTAAKKTAAKKTSTKGD